MYTMKQTCEMTGMAYETLKFYCNAGLVPGVRRDSRNRRIFSDREVAWIKSLICLRKCGLGIAEMRQYVDLCREGESSIPQRQQMLAEKREELQHKLQDIEDAMAYVDAKQQFYADVLSGKESYRSNLIDVDAG